MESKLCNNLMCKEEFFRKENISNAGWSNREYCSDECRPVLLNKHRITNKNNSKLCKNLFCKEEFYRPYGITNKNWNKRNFCNAQCAHNYERSIEKGKRCINCNRVFIRKEKETIDKFNNRKFCNIECQKEFNQKKYGVDNKPCKHCDKLFYRKNRISRNCFEEYKFCSEECKIKNYDLNKTWINETKNCNFCNLLFSPDSKQGQDVWNGRKFCSSRCYHSNNFNENITEEERLFGRFYPEYWQWKKSVLERDNYTCQITLKNTGIICVHHIDGYNWCVEKRTDVNNGICLSEEIHNKFHNEYGRGNNTRTQFNRFVIKEKFNKIHNRVLGLLKGVVV